MADAGLLQSSLRSLQHLKLAPPILIAASEYRFLVAEQLNKSGMKGEILVEPDGRGSAAAIAVVAQLVAATAPDAVLMIMPIGFEIDSGFDQALHAAVEAAGTEALVAFGTEPQDNIEVNASCIELEASADNSSIHQKYKAIHSGSNSVSLKNAIEARKCMVNSEIYLLPVLPLLEAFRTHAPRMLQTVEMAIKSGVRDLDFFRIGEIYQTVEKHTIIEAILSKTTGLVVHMSFSKSGLGSWKDVWDRSARDADGVARVGHITDIGCQDTLLRAEHEQMRLVGVGLKGIVAIAMRDAVLVADMNNVRDVGVAVARMTEENALQAEEFPRCYRPWGWYEQLAVGPRFQVKEIMVKPGGVLSLQSHRCRSEHWTVVSGVAEVTVNDEMKMLHENESVYIPLGAVHRMANPHEEDMHLIEVQCGSYLGEDDIIRYEDIYARV